MKKRIIVILAILLALIPSVQAFTATSDTTVAETCATQTNLFILTIENEEEASDTYTVSFSGSAAKWAVAAPMGFILEKGESQQIFVYVTPARGTLTGSYNLDIIITGAKSGVQKIPITLIVKDCHSAEFSAAQPSQSICSCTLATFPITLKNTGLWTENFQLTLDGTAKSFATLSESTLSLGAGESKEIVVYAKSECTNLGTFNLAVTAKSLNSNALATQKLDLEVKGCYDFSLSVPQNHYSFCENTETKVPLTIENKGTVANSYNLEIAGPNWASLEKTSISASPAGTGTSNIVLYPAMGVKGDFPIRVKATSEQGDIVSDISLTANIQTCHITDLQLAATQDKICPKTSKAYKVSLANSGTFPENYALRVEGAEWASLSKNFITLEAGKTIEIDLEVKPGDVAPGTYPLKIIAESQDISKTSDKKEFILQVVAMSDCFGVKTLAEKELVEVISGEGSLIPIVVENIGSEPAKYTLDVSGTGASYARLNPSSLTVKGNSAETISMYISVPEQTETGTYLITASARSEDGTISSSSTITIRVVETKIGEEIKEGLNETIVEKTEIFTGLSTSLLKLGEKLENWAKGIGDKITASVSKLPKLNETPTQEKPKENITPANITPITLPSFGKYWDSLKDKVPSLFSLASQYWFIILVVLAAVILILLVWGAGWFEKLEEPSFKDEEFEEVEEKEIEKPKGRGLFDGFKDWLKEEEEPFEEEKPKAKKKEPGLWDKFTSWLEEEEVEKPKKKEEAAWKKFTDWLAEEEAPPKKEKPKDTSERAPRAFSKAEGKPKKKGAGAWDKFKKFLEEEEEED